MVLSWKLSWLLLTVIQVNSQSFDNPIANLSTSWTNSPSALHSLNFTDGSTIRTILLRGTSSPQFACGFFCNGNCETYLFAIFIFQTNSSSGTTSGFPQVVWSANPNNPVRINATLQFTSEGDLVLREVDGTLAWSTDTVGKSVAGLSLTEMGNLLLFDANSTMIWQSFDHPTDSLVPGQKLMSGKKLTSGVSATNWTQKGLYSLSVTDEGLFAFLESNPPQAYYKSIFNGTKESIEPSYIKLLNGSLALFILNISDPNGVIPIPPASSVQYMRLDPDGHLRIYELGFDGWTEVTDLLTGYIGECGYPMVCGEYGICSSGQCSCPVSNNGITYFKQINESQPNLGCSETTPITCEASLYQSFLELNNITYFTFSSDLTDTDMESCKQACLRNCSCKAALFQYSGNSSRGNCYLPDQIFTLMNNEKRETHYNSSAFIKVKIGPSAQTPPPGRVAIIVGSSVGAFYVLFMIGGILVFLLWKKRDAGETKEEGYLDQIPGMPTRFSYEDLKATTENFSRKLGEGGFGSVFEGTLSNGTKVAVKRLDGIGQVKKSFLAEVETIGSIHHINLVRLIGFCAEKFHRLLVYEYVSNGSLDKWIFSKNHELSLDWHRRRKIILDIAKGLDYLHEDCRQKLIHLDIKPQNILLDEHFNAKVSDFGMSKLIDRDQSQVMTTMRGTPGYLAPEWLNSVITEKVDVYSYGVVVMEILCGRKNLDRSQPDEQTHLLSLFKKKAEEDRLLDIIDKNSEEMRLHEAEVVEMMRVAAWCLQSDFASRPSMSVVVKILEGVTEVGQDLDYSFGNPPVQEIIEEIGDEVINYGSATPLLPSALSRPR